MKKTIKVLSIMIVLAISLNMLVGCNVDELRAKYSHATTFKRFSGELEENVTLRVLDNDTALKQGYFDELIEAFNKKYEDKGIVAVDANMDSYSDLANDGPYGYGPDVLYQANDVLMKYATSKHILPLPIEKLDCYGQVSEKAWDAYKTTINSKEYTCGVPVNIQMPMLYYRKDMLPADWQSSWDKNNNEVPDMLESWTEMYAFSKEIRQLDDDKYGYMKSLFDPFFSLGYMLTYGGYIFGEDNSDPSEIGLAAGNAELGIQMIMQLATIMNEEATDDTITLNAYSKMAKGEYFATMTTPDVYSMFINQFAMEKESDGMSKADALKYAEENLLMTTIPTSPLSGDLTDRDGEQIGSKIVGGINGYAISSYTKSPVASLEFVNFATNYDNVMQRNEMLGVVPARLDAVTALGGMELNVYEFLEDGDLVIMPSDRKSVV